MYYEQGLSKSAIAREIHLSVTHVNRLLREGMRAGVVKVTVNPKSLNNLELDLVRAFSLRDARVVGSSANIDNMRVDIARIAADLFDGLVGDGMSVGVGSGKTLFEMASRIPERPRRITIYPANLIIERELKVTGASANAVTTIAWFRSRPAAEASRLEMFFPSTEREPLLAYADRLNGTSAVRQLGEAISALDCYFLGASEWRKDSQLAHLRNQFIADKNVSAPIGDLAFNLLESTGDELDSGLAQMILRIPTKRLKEIAGSGKPVVLVAGGSSKNRIVAAALNAQLCNVLVTDSDTAEFLLKQVRTASLPP